MCDLHQTKLTVYIMVHVHTQTKLTSIFSCLLQAYSSIPAVGGVSAFLGGALPQVEATSTQPHVDSSVVTEVRSPSLCVPFRSWSFPLMFHSAHVLFHSYSISLKWNIYTVPFR